MITEKPDAIIVTLPKQFFVEQDHATYLKELQAIHEHEDKVWYRVMKNLPKHDVLYVYTIINNKIHHRTQFAGLIRNTTLSFSRPNGGIRTFENANAVMMTGPVVMAPEEITMKGFQGFRYSPVIF